MKFTSPSLRKAAVPIVVVAAATALAACSSSKASSGGSSGSGGDYVFGVSVPLTGPTTVYGANIVGGLQAYINYVNSNGGVNGKQIKMMQADGGFDTATTVQSLKTLAGDNPIAIGGLLVGSATQGAMPTIASLKIPALISSPVSTFNRPPANPYTFGAGGPVIEDEAIMIMRFAKANLSTLVPSGTTSPRVVTINFNSNGSALARKNFASYTKDYGWNLVDQEAYTTGTTNFDAQAAKIAAEKPDMILYNSDSANNAFIQALKNAGVTVPIITDQGGPESSQLPQLNYPALYVLREIKYPVATDSAMADYLAQVKAVGGKADATNHVTQYGYLQAEVFVNVLKKCGTNCDSASFLTTLKGMTTIDTNGFTFAPIKYTSGDTAGLYTASFYKWNSSTKQIDLLPGTYTYPS